MDKQQTLAGAISIRGRGLHTGEEANLKICPAPENHGIVFYRTDIAGQPSVPALADYVVDTSRGTTLADGEARISTIEHIMAALWCEGVDNARIEIDGPEIPILDGSAKPFCEAIAKVGLDAQSAERRYFMIPDRISYSAGSNGVEMNVYPDDGYSVDVLVDYKSKVLGHQYASYAEGDNFAELIAPCRTFVFLHELEQLREHNLIKGGDLANALVILEHQVSQEELDRMAELFGKPKVSMQGAGILSNEPPLFENEPARHKLLDVLGDLALVGCRLRGRVMARRPGHHANTELAKMIRKVMKAEEKKTNVPKVDLNAEPLMDVVKIQTFLPHRPPFLLVDKIMELSATSVIGVKNVTMNEPFFVGHFPGAPVMPGVLQVEAMAQVGGILVLNTVPDPENYLTYFLRIDNVRFRQKVVPGDTLVFHLELSAPIRRGIAVMRGEVFVGDTLVAEGDLMAQITKSN